MDVHYIYWGHHFVMQGLLQTHVNFTDKLILVPKAAANCKSPGQRVLRPERILSGSAGLPSHGSQQKHSINICLGII